MIHLNTDARFDGGQLIYNNQSNNQQNWGASS